MTTERPRAAATRVRLVPWGRQHAPLLERLVGDPAMMVHLGGPESPEQIANRQRRYELPGSGMYAIVDQASGKAVGSVGFWQRRWRGETVYEVGWSVLPEFQGRGIASAATAQVLEAARAGGRHRFAHAFPAVDNAASNAICRRAGFTLLGPCDFEYPPGHPLRCNDWRYDLTGA